MMTFSKTFISVLFFSVFSFSTNTAIAGSVYKWVDEDGQVHYGSKPRSKDAEEVKIKDRYIDSGSPFPGLKTTKRVEKQKKFIDAMEAEKKSILDEKKKKQENDEMRVARCNAARDQLKRREEASALYDLDEKGNRVLLDKEQYQKAMKQARARVKKWCE